MPKTWAAVLGLTLIAIGFFICPTALADSTSIFVVYGMMYESDGVTPASDPCAIRVTNLRSDVYVDAQLGAGGELGKYSVVFMDCSGNNAAQTGDILEVEATDNVQGTTLACATRPVNIEQIWAQRARIDLVAGTARPRPVSMASFKSAGSLLSPRVGHGAALLPDGRVLIVGGEDVRAEVYDPDSNMFSYGPSLSAVRLEPAVIALPDGDILVAGGKTTDGSTLASAEIYDYSAEVFVPTGGMTCPRFGATATLLQDSTVLVAGGAVNYPDSGALAVACAEVYYLDSAGFVPVGEMHESRMYHAEALLPDGRVLVAGGVGGIGAIGAGPALATAEVYDPEARQFDLVVSQMSAPRCQYGLVRLSDGRVLAAGGVPSSTIGAEPAAGADLFNPGTGLFVSTGSMCRPRSWYGATLLPDGRPVLLGGRTSAWEVTDAAEIYNPRSRRFTEPIFHMRCPRQGFETVLLFDGRTFVVGGVDGVGLPVLESEVLAPGMFIEKGQLGGTEAIGRGVPPRIVFPNGGETIQAGSTSEVVWEPPEECQPDGYAVYYALDDGGYWETIADDLLGESCSWTTPSLGSDACRMMVVAYDAEGVIGCSLSEGPFSLGCSAGVSGVQPGDVVSFLSLPQPNPFRLSDAGVSVEFTVGKSGDVRFSILDTQGRIVRDRLSSSIHDGRGSVRWDGKDALAKPVSAGVYFVRMESAGHAEACKVIVLH